MSFFAAIKTEHFKRPRGNTVGATVRPTVTANRSMVFPTDNGQRGGVRDSIGAKPLVGIDVLRLKGLGYSMVLDALVDKRQTRASLEKVDEIVSGDEMVGYSRDFSFATLVGHCCQKY